MVSSSCSMDAGRLACKPDWPEAQKRWIAFWDHSATDRPCIAVKAPRTETRDRPLPVPPSSLEDWYFDADYVAARWLYQMETIYFGGEAVPVGDFLMGGYALGCGTGVRFAETTVWHPVTMTGIDSPLGWHPGDGDPWQAKMDTVLHRLLDLSPGKFLVGQAGQVMANDLLALLRGVEDFLVDLAMDTDRCRRRLEELLLLWWGLFDHYRGLVESRQRGCVRCWPGLWHPRLILTCQSDISCMISAEMFRRYVVPDLDSFGRRCSVVWYHLDGWGAVHHLPMLLSLPYIRVIQYVSSADQPPNGPHFIDLYRRVQSAGRGLDLYVPMENMEYLIRHLRPEGVVLRTQAETPEQADELLDNAVRWCGTHVGSSG